MRTSDFSRKRKASNPNATSPKDGASRRGFTLLEILVVLALVGMLTALSLPQFTVIRDRLDFTLKRDSFEQELGGLSYLAYKQGRPLVLEGQYPRKVQDGGSSSTPPSSGLDVNDPLSLEPGQYRSVRPAMAGDAPLDLPDSWRVTVDAPIVYQVSGFCGGGAVTLQIGQLRYVYDLKAPVCQAELAK